LCRFAGAVSHDGHGYRLDSADGGRVIAAPVASSASGVADPQRLLRFAFRLDAIVSAASGAVLLLLGPVLVDALGMPLALLWSVGLVCLAYAAALWLAQSRSRISTGTAWTVIGLNVAWAAASLALVVSSALALTVLGEAFIILQAIVVGGLAALQFAAVRRMAQPAA